MIKPSFFLCPFMSGRPYPPHVELYICRIERIVWSDVGSCGCNSFHSARLSAVVTRENLCFQISATDGFIRLHKHCSFYFAVVTLLLGRHGGSWGQLWGLLKYPSLASFVTVGESPSHVQNQSKTEIQRNTRNQSSKRRVKKQSRAKVEHIPHPSSSYCSVSKLLYWLLSSLIHSMHNWCIIRICNNHMDIEREYKKLMMTTLKHNTRSDFNTRHSHR
jgi:hypothetical protein